MIKIRKPVIILTIVIIICFFVFFFNLRFHELEYLLDVLISCSTVKLIIYLCLDLVGSHHCPNNFFFFSFIYFFQFMKNLWNSSLELLRLLKENVI